tara:strand:+ start:920 stop:1243 length:324 start_codon:yes stop_codon:yes gene_type:complete
MPIEIIKNRKDKMILGFIFVSAGSSYYQSSTEAPELIALKAVKEAKRSWKHLFRWKPESKFYVHFYDISNCDYGWTMDDNGLHPILKNGRTIGKRKIKCLNTLTIYV